MQKKKKKKKKLIPKSSIRKIWSHLIFVQNYVHKNHWNSILPAKVNTNNIPWI